MRTPKIPICIRCGIKMFTARRVNQRFCQPCQRVNQRIRAIRNNITYYRKESATSTAEWWARDRWKSGIDHVELIS